jgi:hypothetical protein
VTSGGEEIRGVGADVDLDAFRAEVQADIDRKRQAGQYPATVVFEEEAQADEEERRDDALLTELALLKRAANFTSQVTTESRKPIIGPVVAKSRQLIRVALSWYINGILTQIRSFARHVEGSIRILDDKREALEKRVAALEDEVRALREKMGE